MTQDRSANVVMVVSEGVKSTVEMYLGGRNFVCVRGVFFNGKHRKKKIRRIYFGRVRGDWSRRGLPEFLLSYTSIFTKKTESVHTKVCKMQKLQKL